MPRPCCSVDDLGRGCSRGAISDPAFRWDVRGEESATPRTDRQGARRSRPLIRLNRDDKLSILQKLRFAADSPLEEAVSSEPVSDVKSPASREFTGNFIELRLCGRLKAAK